MRRAFPLYGRAVLHAYAFQALPAPPDRYTVAFYDEMTHRTAGRLIELARDGRLSEAETACGTLDPVRAYNATSCFPLINIYEISSPTSPSSECS